MDFTVTWFSHSSAECLDRFPKSTAAVKFPHPASHECYEMDKMERKSSLKVKDTACKPSYLQRSALYLSLILGLSRGLPGTARGGEEVSPAAKP